MKIAIGSDLHLEKSDVVIQPFDADVLILAGDIHTGTKGVEWAKQFNMPTIYVPGNHEHEWCVWKENINHMREAAQGSNVHFLYNDTVTINGVTFSGTTLWTDFEYGFTTPEIHMMMSVKQTYDWKNKCDRTTIADFCQIYSEHGVFLTPFDVLREHRLCREFVLTEGINSDVLITHFSPITLSVKDTDRFDAHKFYWAVNLDNQIMYGNNKLIVHGHTHRNLDETFADKRFVAHMKGYDSGPFAFKIVDL